MAITVATTIFFGGCLATPPETPPPPPPADGYLNTNQQWIEGLYDEELDLRDVDAVFWRVFSGLPNLVTVYPSENYYYFKLYIDDREIWGNIRIAAGYRERGVISFAYFEFDEFALIYEEKFSRSKLYGAEEGVAVEELDGFTYAVSYQDKTVTFLLHQIPQEPPRFFDLGENEVFVERTFDESGYQFFLIFNEQKNYFLWVLNEENDVPDILDPVGDTDDIVVGRRSGFAFWVDSAHENRKILTTIRQLSVRRNDYYDGPFDQLADNYVDEVHISDYMIKALPALKDRIDEYGYYTDTERPMRVAISPYSTYYTHNEIVQFIAAAKVSGDPYQYISRRGVPTEEDSS